MSDGSTRAVTVGIVGLVTLVAFEALAVSTAMPVVAADLGGIRSYGLAFSLFLTMTLLGTVVGGGWCDSAGPRAPILVGLGLFAGGLVVSGTAQTFTAMLLGRVVSGVGGGFMVVSLYVVVAAVYPASARPTVFGWVSAAWVLPSVLGPPLAGWLATDVTWRVVFLGVPPLVVLVVAGMVPRLGRLGRPPAGARTPAAEHRRRALLGVALAGGATVLQWGSVHLDPPVPVSVAAVVVGLALVALALPRLVPRGTLRAARGLPSVVAVRGLFAGCFFGAEAFVPLMLVSERGLEPAVAGLALTGGAVGWAGGSYVQSRPGLRVGRHVLLATGGLLVAGSVAAIVAVPYDTVPPLALLPIWTVAGLGMGLGMSSTSVLVLGLSASGEEGRNSASLQVSDALGGVLGIGAAGALFAALHTTAGQDADAFAVIWSVLALVGLLAAFVGSRARPETVAPAPSTSLA